MRSPKGKDGDDPEVKKGAWTPEEDQKLVHYIEKHGQGSWQLLPKKAGLNRCGKSCRLRWTNYLRPDIKRGNFAPQEEQAIIELHSVLGNKWSMIAARLPGRTDNEIKNYWNTHLRKRLIQSGIDPNTHQPLTYPMLPDSHIAGLMNSSPLENIAKIGILCSILQILKANNPLPLPLGRLEIENLNQSQQINPLQISSSSMAAATDPLHGAFDPFETMPTLNDSSLLIGCTNDSLKTDESLPPDRLNDDELEQMLNYKEVFGSNKLFENDVWGEVIDIDGEEGSSSSSWKHVFSELFPAL